MRDEGCGIGLVGLGVSLPDTVRRNDAWETPPPVVEALNDAADPFRGAVERRVLESGRDSTELEVAACRASLRSADLGPDDVTMMFGFSQTPRNLQPGNHGVVARDLGLGGGTLVMSLDAGCASFVSQLHVATALLRSAPPDSLAVGLLYQSCAASRTTDYAGPLAPVVGDGAVSEVVGRVEPGLGLVGVEEELKAGLCDGLVMASTDGRARWTDPAGAGSRFVDTVRDSDSARLMAQRGPEFARDTCGRLLARHGYTSDDVALFACTQPSLWFGEACAASVGIGADRVVPPREHFQRFGHLLPASAPLNLWIAWQTGRLEKGDLVLMYLQGAGFIQAAVLLRWSMARPD